MAAIRRLSDEDVRSIFESVQHGLPPPVHLPFQIVPVGLEGLRLSPPSYQFEDGLYILMKPQKKKAHPSEQPKVPPHLLNHVMHDIPSSFCPWSLSGPQFPQPTGIQQRYCYPKGDPEYSSRKGGALWTLYGADGKENIDFRLLHVYFSAKRAMNKGVTASTPKRAKKFARKSCPANQVVSPFDMKPPTALPSLPSPTMSPMPSPNISPVPFRSNFVSPFDDNTFHPMPESPFRPRILTWESREDEQSHQHSTNFDPFHFELETPSMKELEDTSPAKLPVSPFPMKQTFHPTLPSPTISPIPFSSSFVSAFDENILPDSPFRPRILAVESRDDVNSHQQPITLDPFHFDLETTSMQYLEDACWSDPLFRGCLLE